MKLKSLLYEQENETFGNIDTYILIGQSPDLPSHKTRKEKNDLKKIKLRYTRYPNLFSHFSLLVPGKANATTEEDGSRTMVTKRQLKNAENSLVRALGLNSDGGGEFDDRGALRERSADPPHDHIHLPDHDHAKWKEMRESSVVSLKVSAKASGEEEDLGD